ncbi:MAG: hydrogenase subunit MbhD domain-containing protein [Xanthomonadaceae bacterium]|nr:hydrogenase subunit MbhD domain-containing protein [Xanthomonadaceae bacterium]
MSVVVDFLLASGLLWLGWRAVAERSLFRSIVMFVSFGLVMALAWARLRAPDLALAEAAIGAGMTGAMLMLAYRRLLLAPAAHRPRAAAPRWLATSLAVLSALLALALGKALLGLPDPLPGAGALALAGLDDTGLGNPVTAVLLLFRGYDTLLEMLVLLVAWLGAATAAAILPSPPEPIELRTVPLLDALLSVLVPTTVLVGGYLLHVGGRAPGGAFQAGAVLAAAGIVLALSGRLRPEPQTNWPQALTLILGAGAFAALGTAALAFGAAAMSLTGLWAVYLIETAMTVSIAMTLVLLFLGAAGVRRATP